MWSPISDNGRVPAVDSLRLARSAPSPELDEIVRLAATLFGMPAALMTVVDRDIMWVRASTGLEHLGGMPADQAICSEVVKADETIVTAFDRPPSEFRFHAGAPIRVDGACVGALCIFDRAERSFPADSYEALEALARTSAVLLGRQTRPALSLVDDDAVEAAFAFSDSGLVLYELPPGAASPRVAYANDTILRRSGLTLAELLDDGTRFSDFPGHRAIVAQLAERAKARDERAVDALVACRDGKMRWIESRARRLADGPDGSIRFISISRDVSDRKQDEAFRHLLSESIEQTPEAVLIVRMNDEVPLRPGFVYVNEAFTKLTGYDRDGEYPKILGPESDVPAVIAATHAVTSGYPAEGQTFLYHRSGTPFLAHFRAHPVDVPERHAVIIIEDITEKREQQRFMTILSTAIEDAEDFVSVADDTPDERGGPLVVYSNRALLAATGYAAGEVIGRRYDVLFSPENRPQTLSAIHDAVRELKPGSREMLLRRKDGSDFWIEVTSRPFVVPGESRTYRLFVGRDITQRRRSLNQIALLVAATDQTSDAIVLYEPQPDGTLQVSYENQAASESAKKRLLNMWANEGPSARDLRDRLLSGAEFRETIAEIDARGLPRLVQFGARAVINGNRVEAIVSLERVLAAVEESKNAEGQGLLVQIAGMLTSLVRTQSTYERLSVLSAILLAAFGAEIVADTVYMPTSGVHIAMQWNAAKFELAGASYTIHWKRHLDGMALTALRLCVEATLDEERKQNG